MTMSLPDIYIYYANGLVALQGASQAAIDLLEARYPLSNGTTAHVVPECAEEAFAVIDAAELQTQTC